MSQKRDLRVVYGSVLLGVSGALILVSMLLPWGHPRTHGRELVGNWWALFEVMSNFLWLETLYYMTWVVVYFLQVVMGFTLLVGACIPSPKINSSVCFLHHLHVLGLASVVLMILFGFEYFDQAPRGRLLALYAGGAALFAVLTLGEVVVYYKAFKKSKRFGDSVHVIPLIVFLLIGFIAGWFLRNSETWHGLDFLVVGFASVIGLGGIWMRNRE